MTPIENMKARAQTDAAIDRFEALVRNARPVPLTGQVRFDLTEAMQVVAELREAVAAERRGPKPGQ